MIIPLIVAIGVGLVALSSYRLSPLLFGSRSITLKFSPNYLHVSEVIIAIALMIVKSISTTAFGVRQSTKELTLTSPFILSEKDVARYQAAIGQSDQKELARDSAHLLLFLSGVTEPAMLLLLTSPACPINPLGAVNVQNRFELLRPDLCDLPSFQKLDKAALFARVRGEARHVKRGVEYDLEVSINVPHAVGEGGVVPIFLQIFTMLEFRKTKGSNDAAEPNKKKVPANVPQAFRSVAQLSLSGNDPLRWAALCKDYNFIHLSGLAAKLFGLPGKLAHGNHAVAKALQKILEIGHMRSLGNAPSWMEVQFKKPMVVPGVFDIETHRTDAGFTISRNGKVHVSAEYGLV